jgi:hypothetical protein
VSTRKKLAVLLTAPLLLLPPLLLLRLTGNVDENEAHEALD